MKKVLKVIDSEIQRLEARISTTINSDVIVDYSSFIDSYRQLDPLFTEYETLKKVKEYISGLSKDSIQTKTRRGRPKKNA